MCVCDHYLLNLLFTIIKFHELYQNGKKSIAFTTIVRKLPPCLICRLKILNCFNPEN